MTHQDSPAISDLPFNEPPRRRLGRTGLMVSDIGLGGAWLLGPGGDRPLEEGAQIVLHALERGVNLIDTAECYGESERAVGIALEHCTREVVLATKFGHIPSDFDFSRTAVRDSIRRSRERLRNHPIDLLQIHTPPEPDWNRIAGPDGAIEALREARERGWCRFVGITGRDLPFLRRCLDTDFFDTLLLFFRYDLVDQSGDALLRQAQAQDVGVLLGSPLRMGLLGAQQGRAADSEAEQRQLDGLHTLFDDAPGGLPAAAIRFASGHPAVSSVLSGAGSKAELDEILACDRSPLPPKIDARIRALAASV